MKRTKLFSFFLILALGCAQPQEIHVKEVPPSHTKAVSQVYPLGESGVTGTVFFEQTDTGVSVTAQLNGLEPGNHGFHIHQYGDCTAADGTSAGGHFNPAGNDHSGPDAESRHMGDMGNITADATGNASINYTDQTINIDQIIGRGIVVHAGEDDLNSQPSGAAGPRVACGVIGIQN